MFFRRRLVERYVLAAILPYFLLSLTLLSLAIIAQQTTRFAEVLGIARAPLKMAAEVLINLLPNILVFTVPTAALVGTIIGFSRMNSDSELIALRAAGVSKYRIVLTPLLLGLALCLITYLLSFNIAPAAARDLRTLAGLAALEKFESPVEPRTFFTELPGKVIFVREGVHESGQWGRVFIHWLDGDGVLRLVTARAGRIDSSGGQSELVLQDAEVIAVPAIESLRGAVLGEGKITSERSSVLRMKDERLDAGRKDLLRRINEREATAEELSWGKLRAAISREAEPQRRVNLLSSLHRRAALCLAPLLFTFFGTGIGLRARRGGRGAGMFLSIVSLIIYYLLTVGGDNLGRSGVVPQALGSWAASVAMGAAGLLLFFGGGGRLSVFKARAGGTAEALNSGGRGPKMLMPSINWGLMDRYILRGLSWNFVAAFTVLVFIFLTFTLFDLLRFASSREDVIELILRYLLFMIPFAGIAMAPMGVLVAVLGTYALMARRGEAVAWWASGRSAYRLAVPGLIFAGTVGAFYVVVQESVLPRSNRIQNSLRAQIRGSGVQVVTGGGREWLAPDDMRVIYTYAYDYGTNGIVNPTIFEFDQQGVHLQSIAFGERGRWDDGTVLKIGHALVVRVERGNIAIFEEEMLQRPGVARDVFKPSINNPAEMNMVQLSRSLKKMRDKKDPASTFVSMSIEEKRAGPFSPLVLALAGIPMAYAFGRRSAITALCAAVLIGLAFWAMRSGFFYLGVRGLLPATVAAWTPEVTFAAVGIYLMTRART